MLFYSPASCWLLSYLMGKLGWVNKRVGNSHSRLQKWYEWSSVKRHLLYGLFVCVYTRATYFLYSACVCVFVAAGCLCRRPSVCYSAVLCNRVVSLYIFSCPVHVKVWLQTLLRHNNKYTHWFFSLPLTLNLVMNIQTHEYVHTFVPTLRTVLINITSNGSHESSSRQAQVGTYSTMIRLHACKG